MKSGGGVMDKIIYMNESINRIVWGKYMIFFLLFTGFWLLIRTKFLPITHMKLIYKKTLGSLGKKGKTKGITPFQAVSTALAGTLGVGSVVGVTTALTMGGPGALLWMCISAFFGMMSKYAEVVLAIHYRETRSDGTHIGGPMTTLEHGCHMPFLGVLFALFCIFASFGIGNVTPANTIASTITSYVAISPTIIGILLAVVIGVIILGKANAIMKVNEIIIPIISVIYIGACLYLIGCHLDALQDAVMLVWKDAFHFQSGIGGVSGFAITKAMHFGISRGVFSNEAGMGSSPISHASVANVNAVEQGFWGIFEVFFDTIVVCTITALVILTSGLLDSGLEGVTLTVKCFESGFGAIGGIVFAISIVSFAIPSILGWYYYARECIHYLCKGNLILHIYQICFLLLLIMGSKMNLSFVWDFADTLNGLMAIPNLISLVILCRVVVKLTKEYMIEHRSD